MRTSEARERIRRAYYIDHKSVRHIPPSTSTGRAAKLRGKTETG